MKTLCLFALILVWQAALPVFAQGCLPEAVSCSSPIDNYGTPHFAGVEKESTLFQAGVFSLDGVDNGDGSRLGIRPSFKLGETGKLSVRIGRNKGEFKAGWTFQ